MGLMEIDKGSETESGKFVIIFILFYFIFFISWRLITLQDCSGFCHTLK